jgi:hypothetical protein
MKGCLILYNNKKMNYEIMFNYKGLFKLCYDNRGSYYELYKFSGWEWFSVNGDEVWDM